MPKLKWTKAVLMQEIFELHEKGEDLSFSSAKKNHSRIYFAAIAKDRFGSWQKAVEAAGIDYQLIRKRPHTVWTRDSLISAIHSLYEEGEDLNTTAMQRHHPAVFAAAISKHHFGSWRNAIEAAGILDRVEIRFRGTQQRWSKEQILEEIQRIHKESGDLSSSAVSKYNAAIVLSARLPRYFGSWQAAVEAAGFNYADVRKTQPLTEADVLDKIKMLFDAGDDLQSHRHPNLHASALRKFGRWEDAIRAAGVDYSQLREHWTKERIIAEIKNMAKDGHNLCWSAVISTHPSLYHNARRIRMFGSWKNAVDAAGETITPATLSEGVVKGRPRIWSAKKVLEEMREIDAAGKPLWKQAKNYPNLNQAAWKYFGGWKEAIGAAGVHLKREDHVPVDKQREHQFIIDLDVSLSSAEQVQVMIQELHAAGKPLWKKAKDYPELSKAARDYCGGWLSALKMAGVLNEEQT